MLLGQVQSIALTSQFNVDMPEAYSSFTSEFGWANLQLNLLGSWDPPEQSPASSRNSTQANATDGAAPPARRRRRLASGSDGSERSEECSSSSSEGGGDAANASANATLETSRDGKSPATSLAR